MQTAFLTATPSSAPVAVRSVQPRAHSQPLVSKHWGEGAHVRDQSAAGGLARGCALSAGLVTLSGLVKTRRERRRMQARARRSKVAMFQAPVTRSTVSCPLSMGRSPAGEQFVWEWRPRVGIHFVRSAKTDKPQAWKAANARKQEGFAVLMVHGFGASSAYYYEQLRAVEAAGGVGYAIDLLGQGNSWPSEDPTPAGGLEASAGAWGHGDELHSAFEEDGGLRFGEPAWLDQLTDFISGVVLEKRVYILGNSLGGYLGTKMAARLNEKEDEDHPGISGLILANSTPYWGWTYEGWPVWDGQLPVPNWVRPLASAWFEGLRSNIGPMLGLVYADANHAEVSRRLEVLADHIEEASSHPMGKAAFASILLAPRQEPDFGDALDTLAASDMPLLLLYGDDDPWIQQWWADRAANRASISQFAEYYGLSPAGHCPHHEAPEAFNRVLIEWLLRAEAHGSGDTETAKAAAIEVGAKMLVPSFAEIDEEDVDLPADNHLVVIERRL